MQKLLLYTTMLVLLCSCKTQNLFEGNESGRSLTPTVDSAFVYNPKYQYTIRKDDKISIGVWGQDDLGVGSVYGIYNSNEAYGKFLMVDADGNIEIPKIGTLKVVNQTIPKLKDTLRKLYGKWVINPIVDVKVLNKSITVLGEVRNPASITVDKDNNTLMELIAKTGGYETYANLRFIRVFRQEGSSVRMATIDVTRSDDYLNRNIQLHPGDVVVVTSKPNKEFDRRISIIIPFATAITAATLLFKVL